MPPVIFIVFKYLPEKGLQYVLKNFDNGRNERF